MGRRLTLTCSSSRTTIASCVQVFGDGVEVRQEEVGQQAGPTGAAQPQEQNRR